MANAATAVPLAPRQAKAAAVKRVQARAQQPLREHHPSNRPPVNGTSRVQLHTGTIADPEDLDEWIDDRVARCVVADGACNVLIEVFERLRGGVDAVPGAIAFAARELRNPQQQWPVWLIVKSLPGGKAPVDVLRARIKQEWRNRKLWDQDHQPPKDPFGVEETNRNTVRPTVTRYRSEYGHPAGMTA